MILSIDERAHWMMEAYGPAMTYAKAAQVLHLHPGTIKNMLADGRLDYACEGTKVCTYSVAQYIAAPKQMDCEARQRKKRPSSKWAV